MRLPLPSCLTSSLYLGQCTGVAVCISVCLCVLMYSCMSFCIHVMSFCMYICRLVCMFVYHSVYLFVCVYGKEVGMQPFLSLPTNSQSVYIYACLSLSMKARYGRICVYISARAPLHAYIYVCLSLCMHHCLSVGVVRACIGVPAFASQNLKLANTYYQIHVCTKRTLCVYRSIFDQPQICEWQRLQTFQFIMKQTIRIALLLTQRRMYNERNTLVDLCGIKIRLRTSLQSWVARY